MLLLFFFKHVHVGLLACMCPYVLFTVCVPQAVLILWMWIRMYLYCTSAEPADCSTSSQVMWNVSGTEHRMCSSGPQHAVRAHTHSLSHSVIYMLTHSFLFPPSLPLSPRLWLCHCTATHDIMGLLLCHFVCVTSAHSVFVLGHHVKFASVHTWMRKRVTMRVIPVMQYLLCTKVSYSLDQTQN